MARNLNAKKRREIKRRKVMPHQQSIDGKFPVYAFTLKLHTGDNLLNPVSVYMAPAEPLVQGFNKHSQTAIVMQALERYGAENARL